MIVVSEVNAVAASVGLRTALDSRSLTCGAMVRSSQHNCRLASRGLHAFPRTDVALHLSRAARRVPGPNLAGRRVAMQLRRWNCLHPANSVSSYWTHSAAFVKSWPVGARCSLRHRSRLTVRDSSGSVIAVVVHNWRRRRSDQLPPRQGPHRRLASTHLVGVHHQEWFAPPATSPRGCSNQVFRRTDGTSRHSYIG